MHRILSFLALSLILHTVDAQNMRIVSMNLQGNPDFTSTFLPKTLRIDYFLAGDFDNETVFLSRMSEEPFYGGSQKNLVDNENLGTYRYAVYDSASGELLFSRGFCSLFQEWRGTPEAKMTTRAFPMTAVLPFPQRTILFTIDIRSYETGEFTRLYSLHINPKSYFIYKDKIDFVESEKFIDSGDPANRVDIVFIAEGYTKKQIKKFKSDARRMAAYMMTQEPFNKYSDKFNFYAVCAESDESGVDIPGTNTYVNTNINSSFYTFDMDRYLTTFDTKSIYDLAANVPYDHIVVLNNSTRYGGGGFFNHYSQSTVDHKLSQIVMVHEFGHGFGGLADEYYSSQVTYSDFYNLKVEPWEPNITTNVAFEKKWKSLIPEAIPVPTPREPAFSEVVGMFEGGGYVGKGVYSPMMDCRMKSNEAPRFCPVCQQAIERRIKSCCD